MKGSYSRRTSRATAYYWQLPIIASLEYCLTHQEVTPDGHVPAFKAETLARKITGDSGCSRPFSDGNAEALGSRRFDRVQQDFRVRVREAGAASEDYPAVCARG